MAAAKGPVPIMLSKIKVAIGNEFAFHSFLPQHYA
jgi:hypothetical protein